MNQTLLTYLGVGAAIVVAVIYGIFMRNHDRTRIHAYLAGRGGRLLEAAWTGQRRRTGWFIGYDDNRRWYRVTYIDREGNERLAVCSCGRFGIDLDDETVLRYVDEPDHPSPAQEAENRLLREEEERLARKAKKDPPAF